MTAKKDKNQDLVKPGQQLQSLREKKGLSVKVVADQLRLDKEMIHALENDDYDQFPATTYIRGYIRGYAKYLDIDSTPLIRAFDQYAGDEPEITPFVSSPEPQMKSDDKHMRVVTYAIIGVMLLSLGLWWKSWRIDPDAAVTLGQVNGEFVTGNNDSQQPLSEGVSGVGVDSLEALPTLDPLATESASQSDELEHEYGVVVFTELPEIDPTQENDEIAPEYIVKDVESIDDSLEDAATPHLDHGVTPVPEEGQPLPDIATFEADQQKGSSIVVVLEGVSWIQISDANDIRVYSGLAGPDEKINVHGMPPFRVVVGKTNAVTKITYGDRVVDLTPLTRGNVARFFVDQSGAYH